ncbi:PAS domain S-box-containing protein [Litoreibacter meonggei]|uniref:histidine kinase n=1 Tax=Litoreibacter meonggei TaxID=1049199 RepID=A0A497UZ78_9RHOB|nr:PAS domain-containing protein [Litoreibacter meonggei]RLJ36142.1 PAS domain S-box-containing protein [Litoreibacter meonggei]
MSSDTIKMLETAEFTAEDTPNNTVFAHAIQYSRLPLCLTDPTKPDEPIVFANPAFCELTGYAEEDFIGKNCRFLQGPETTQESVDQIRQALTSNAVAMVEIVNYRKSGEKFINALQIGPVFDDDGNLIFHFGSQLDISIVREQERQLAALKNEELLHRLKNIVNVMTIVIKMTGRSETDPQEYSKKIVDRLTALGQAHFAAISTNALNTMHLKELAQMLLIAYAPLGESQVLLSGDDVVIPEQSVTSLTLLLHELATNAVKHGSLGVEGGMVDLTWQVKDTGELYLKWEERHGPAVSRSTRESGSGIVSTLIAASGGSLTFDWKATGLIAELDLPVNSR